MMSLTQYVVSYLYLHALSQNFVDLDYMASHPRRLYSYS